MESKKLFCPKCKSLVVLQADGKWPEYFPFCSKRCKLMDLGAWAKEEYRMPAENQSADEDSNESEIN